MSAKAVAILLVMAAVVALDAVPLSRYGRANLSRYGKRSQESATIPTDWPVCSGKGLCKHTGIGDLHWCQFPFAPSGDSGGAINGWF